MHHLDDGDAGKIGIRRHQPRDDGIVDVVFGGEQNDIAERGMPFVARPRGAARDACDDVAES
jgi:hypothetical protein